MQYQQLWGRYDRLRRELEIEFRASSWNTGRIDRLADDLAKTELKLAELKPAGALGQDFGTRPPPVDRWSGQVLGLSASPGGSSRA